MTTPVIDTCFDFRTDAQGKDPDRFSPTLRRYHRLLWSKPLPCGVIFDLDETRPGIYLHHRSELGEFFLASDTVVPTFTRWHAMQPIITQFSQTEIDEFLTPCYSIGGMLIFPGNKIGNRLTINGARGFLKRIADRLDLTLRCIRRQYRSEASPLAVTLERYADFFSLFGDFPGYIEFFLLQDLVTDKLDQVNFFMQFDNFAGPSVPTNVAMYKEYRRRSLEFVGARNSRIDQWVSSQGGGTGRWARTAIEMHPDR